MPQFDDNHVKICGCYVVWDGVTNPETISQGSNAGKPKWTLKVVINPNNPDLALFQQLANKCLLESKWKGQLPAGGRMPVIPVQPGEFNDMFAGWVAISFKTTLRCPDVYDEHGNLLDPMQYGQLIYGGQKVDVLAHCYQYDNAGNKGISGGLDGLAIITSANAVRQNFGSAGVDTAAAFGGQPAAPGVAPQPAAVPGAPPAYQPPGVPGAAAPAPYQHAPVAPQPQPAAPPATVPQYGQPAAPGVAPQPAAVPGAPPAYQPPGVAPQPGPVPTAPVPGYPPAQ